MNNLRPIFLSYIYIQILPKYTIISCILLNTINNLKNQISQPQINQIIYILSQYFQSLCQIYHTPSHKFTNIFIIYLMLHPTFLLTHLILPQLHRSYSITIFYHQHLHYQLFCLLRYHRLIWKLYISIINRRY